MVEVLKDSGISPTKDSWRLTCAADWMPRGGHAAAMVADPVGFYGDLFPALSEADLRLVNVECVLGDAGEPIAKAGPNLRAGVDTAASLTSVPFDVACLANNHCLDFGPEALSRTVDALHDSGLATVGAGVDGEQAARPLETRVRGVDVAVINCAEGEACRSVDGGPGAYGIDLRELERQIKDLKAAGRVVVVVFHGGREHVPVPPPYVVHSLRAIAEMGPDVVIGHHPHVPQGIEVHGGVPIAYSLGNFAFDFWTAAYYHHVGYLLHVDFSADRVVAVHTTAYVIEPNGLCLLTGAPLDLFENQLGRATAPLADDAWVGEAWDAVVDHYVTAEQARKHFQRGIDALADRDGPGIAAAANLFFTPAHNELLAKGLRRIASGTHGNSPLWARELLHHWLNYPLADGLRAQRS